LPVMKRPPEIFETERLQLRRLDMGMAMDFYTLFERNFDVLLANAVLPLAICERAKNTPQNIDAWVLGLSNDWQWERRYAWAVFQKTNLKSPIGYFEVDVESIMATADGVKGNLCYWIDENYHRQGIMKEVLSTSKPIIAGCGWSHLEIEALSHNTPSVRLAERLGFTRYGRGLGAYTGAVSLLYQLELRPVKSFV